ncbi:MAG: HAMP domain-containing histidine kinase [Planctomycetales bacterium]|nr:HAMP domain-containing histidine kinase [Planctomycetales bacterium]
MEFPRTLRLRLTLWNTAIVLLMVVATLIGVREGLRLSLLHETDELLLEDALEVRLTVEQADDLDHIHQELDRKAQSHTHRGLYVRLYDRRDNAIWASVNSPEAKFSTALFTHDLKPVTAENYRLVHLRIDKPGLPYVTIRVGCTLDTMQAQVLQLTELILIVGVLVLVLSPIGGYWLAGRATRPLAKIIDATNRLHPHNLAERLPQTGTRDELDRLAHTINGFLNRIAAYIEQNREFTANAAHELRSPLAAIQSSLEVALNSDRTTAEYQELLADLLDETSQLTRLINQLLLLAESDAGRLELSGDPFPFDRVVERAVEMFRGVAEAAEIELRAEIDHSIWVRGDASRLRQVINNLIDNAIKYNRPGGWVRVELRRDAAQSVASLTVSDRGIGIASNDLPLIFERFYRGDKSRHREAPEGTHGTGLGLSICHAVVTAHGGTISAKSGSAGGTIFAVTLPLCESPASSPPTTAATSHAESSRVDMDFALNSKGLATCGGSNVPVT